jgi:short chain dehydrogenase
MTNPARSDDPATDPRHLLVIGAGPGLGGAIAHRFAQGGYHLTLLARHTDGLAKLASALADAGAAAGTVTARSPGLQRLNADAGLAAEQRRRPPAPGLRRRCRRGHRGHPGRCPGDAGRWRRDHLVHRRRLGRPPGPAWGTISLGKTALRSAATMLGPGLAGDGIRVASITIAGQIRPGTPFSPDQIAEKYWSVVQSEGTWHSEFRFDGT